MAIMKFPKVSPNSLRAFAIEIKNEMSGWVPVDDSRISIRHIESEVLHVHGQVQKEIDMANEQLGIMPEDARLKIYPCLPLKDTTDFDCKCVGTEGKFKKVTLPTLYKFKNESFIKYFGSTNMRLSFTPMSDIVQMSTSSSTKERPAFFMMDNVAYVSLPADFALMCAITVMAIPENPNDTGGKCFDVWSGNWNVEQYVKATVKTRVKRNFAELVLQTSQNPDVRNNAQDGNLITSILSA